jgi:SAM-dependent methyltransferase
MSNLKKRLFRSLPVQAAVSLSAWSLAAGKGSQHSTNSTPLAAFREWLSQLNNATIIELGTLRTSDRPSTVRRDWAPPGSRYIASDFQSGADVDIVADAEKLSQTFAPSSADAVIACSVFEHIRKLWLAAEEISKVLKPGGMAFIQTHHTYPLHAYPHDYWRFSREALETLFSEENGFRDQQSWYEFPASVLSDSVDRAASIFERQLSSPALNNPNDIAADDRRLHDRVSVSAAVRIAVLL